MSKRCDCCGQALPEFGGITADNERGEIRFGGKRKTVSQHEFALFRLLLDSKGRPRSKEVLLEGMYGMLPEADEPEIKIIDVFICKLRAKIKPLGLSIETHWGRGYSLSDPTGVPDATG